MLGQEFFPTPPKLVSLLLAGIKFDEVSTVLEPSAGKGDIAAAIAKRFVCVRNKGYHRYEPDYDGKEKLDCIELSDPLRATLKGSGFRVVHDDFLTYQTRKHYDLIVMNPPFSDGDRHLLKALELAQYGGQVRCILNAETIRNPYDWDRKVLAHKLAELGATITYHAGAFAKAERPTDVEIALISVSIPDSSQESIILEDLRAAMPVAERKRVDQADLVSADFVEAIVARYRFEVDAGVRLIHEYQRIYPHLLNAIRPDRCGTTDSDYRKPILALTIDDRKAGGDNVTNSYVRLSRLKYWQALFEHPQFVGQLTSNLRAELSAKVEALAEYEFSRVNILSIQCDLSKQTIASIEDTIVKQFDHLSREHSWDDTSANRHYYNGWCTNKSWKINEKVILPGHAWDTLFHRWDYSRSAQELTDLEKCLTFLNGGLPPEVSISAAMGHARDAQQSAGIESSFFSVTFYKKGTCHVRFRRRDLLDRLNRFGAQRKAWLPPSYGKRAYADMDQSERDVIDSFEGEATYAKVMADPGKYLVEASGMLRLTDGSEAA